MKLQEFLVKILSTDADPAIRLAGLYYYSNPLNIMIFFSSLDGLWTLVCGGNWLILFSVTTTVYMYVTSFHGL